jgi:hypothetical protein
MEAQPPVRELWKWLDWFPEKDPTSTSYPIIYGQPMEFHRPGGVMYSMLDAKRSRQFETSPSLPFEKRAHLGANCGLNLHLWELY